MLIYHTKEGAKPTLQCVIWLNKIAKNTSPNSARAKKRKNKKKREFADPEDKLKERQERELDLDRLVDRALRQAQAHHYISSQKQDVKLFPHQEATIEKAKKQLKEDGRVRLIVAHTMGTGKTMTATKIAEMLHEHEKNKGSKHNKVLVVAPSSIRTHFIDHFGKFSGKEPVILTEKDEIGIHPADVHIVSYDFFRNNILHFLEHADKYKTLVVDEAHNTRNPKAKLTQSLRALVDSRPDMHAIFLTGSITNNRPEELGVLLRNLLGRDFAYGEDYGTFGKAYLRLVKEDALRRIKKKAPSRAHLAKQFWGHLDELPEKYQFTREGQKELAELLKKHVDYIGLTHLKKLPQQIEENVEIEMSPLQEEAFQAVANTTKRELQRMLAEGKEVNPILRKGLMVAAMKARMLANDPRVVHSDLSIDRAIEHSPKIQKVVEDTQKILEEDPNNAVVIYTNFVKHGAHLISRALEAKGIDHYLFHGGLSKEQRQKMVDDFKNYRKRVIIVTPAGNEGISLNNGSHLLMVDPHPNPEKQKQAETRIRRLNSLHPKVTIVRYFAVPKKKQVKKPYYAFGPDWSIMGLAFEKDWKKKVVYKLLEKASKNITLKSAREEDMSDIIDSLMVFAYYLHY